VLKSPNAASFRSTDNCAPTCRISSAAGDIARPPCWRTKRAMRRRRPQNGGGPQESFDARVIPSVAYTDPEIAWWDSRRSRLRKRASLSRKASSHGRRAVARCHSGVMRASRNSYLTPIRTGYWRRHCRTNAGELMSEIALPSRWCGRGRHRAHHPSSSDAIGDRGLRAEPSKARSRISTFQRSKASPSASTRHDVGKRS